MLEYHSLTLYWTITMSLRLVLSDMLIYVISTGMDGIPASSAGKVEDNRVQLMDYAINVLRTICYAIDTENRAIGPFVFATAFQLAIAVLEREHGFLKTTPGQQRQGPEV
ncbi:hypothetical protein N7456_013280 [Penicillium angulare]|uniref:Uncharacterized protein n=1 Tax=Penicillium angulare TaxID=116970 RepID=A0A9W9EFT9_9EURO|nr:hypothetical protein N7456_013280 [Penicillium angulare]